MDLPKQAEALFRSEMIDTVWQIQGTVSYIRMRQPPKPWRRIRTRFWMEYFPNLFAEKPYHTSVWSRFSTSSFEKYSSYKTASHSKARLFYWILKMKISCILSYSWNFQQKRQKISRFGASSYTPPRLNTSIPHFV